MNARFISDTGRQVVPDVALELPVVPCFFQTTTYFTDAVVGSFPAG